MKLKMDNKTVQKTTLWNRDSDNLQTSLRQPNFSNASSISSSSNNSTLGSQTEISCTKGIQNDSIQTRLKQAKNVSNSSKSSSQSSSSLGLETEMCRVLKGIQNLDCSQRNNLSVQEVAAKSNLKADAPEWFPSSSTANLRTNIYVEPLHNSKSSVQGRLKIHKMSSENESSINYSNDNAIFKNQDDDDDGEDYSSDMKRIKYIIATLTRDPGQFDDLIDIFLETLSPHLDDIAPISSITKTLVNEALSHTNFRYTGAKLCWFIEPASPQFRAELYMRCEKKIEDTSDIQNVSLFIAELYTQLPHLNIYGALLIRSFEKLFEKGENDDIKCICQALKLTGYCLERSNAIELNEIFIKLKEVKNNISGTALTLLNSVLTLRSTNWGHTNEVSESADEEHGFDYDDFHNDTVFYNTDGEVLTKEENEFIAAHMNYSEDFLSDFSDPDDLCDPEPEMDEEIQAAFREFVKFSSKQ